MASRNARASPAPRAGLVLLLLPHEDRDARLLRHEVDVGLAQKENSLGTAATNPSTSAVGFWAVYYLEPLLSWNQRGMI